VDAPLPELDWTPVHQSDSTEVQSGRLRTHELRAARHDDLFCVLISNAHPFCNALRSAVGAWFGGVMVLTQIAVHTAGTLLLFVPSVSAPAACKLQKQAPRAELEGGNGFDLLTGVWRMSDNTDVNCVADFQ